jgi:hypothetical protein
MYILNTMNIQESSSREADVARGLIPKLCQDQDIKVKLSKYYLQNWF